MSQHQAALSSLNIRYPNQTFRGKLVFHGAKRVAELREAAPAHSRSDCYLLLPKDRVAFIGDLGFFQCQPYMGVCDPQAWMAQLEALEQLDVDAYVPGHGPLGSKADLALQSRYIQELEELVRQAIADGSSAEQAMDRDLPPPFAGWLHGGMARWEVNIHSAYERHTG
jgi:glyoxylase-like metal-dependent hydrolase (beta-lactamase superfamily II)